MTACLKYETRSSCAAGNFPSQGAGCFAQLSQACSRALGEAILDVQHGKRIGMPLSRPMQVIGSGVSELRVKDRSGIYRAFYLAKSLRGVLVFHAFQKKTQKTPSREINLARQRFREMVV